MTREPPKRYYKSFSDDFVTSKDQDHRLPEDYKWIKTDLSYRFLSALSYALALVISSVWCRLFLHVRIKNSRALRKEKKGAFIYGNHTQPVGDVFIPALASFPRRIYTVVSPANLGIPFIGRILPYLGALPVPDTLHGLRDLSDAINFRLEQKKNIVIYPEAHVWEYYTGIRPFSDTSFTYPAKYDKPVFCMTTVYKKRRFGKKPAAVVYIDGPFYRDTSEKPREQAKKLHDSVFKCMQKRSLESNCQYIVYEKSSEQIPQTGN